MDPKKRALIEQVLREVDSRPQPEGLSGGTIAVFVDDVIRSFLSRKADKMPEEARQLLEEIDRQLQQGTPPNSHLVDYFHRAMNRLKLGYSTDDAFGLAVPEHRPKTNAERDVWIAYLVQRTINTGKYTTQETAAYAVGRRLRNEDPGFDLSGRRILNIYKKIKKPFSIKARAKYKSSKAR